MHNSPSPSPILDFGEQHATVARVPITARSLEIAAQRSVLLRPRGKLSPVPRPLPTGPSPSSSTPLLKAGKLSLKTHTRT